VRIGAASGDINEEKLGKDLEEVLTKLIAMTPPSTTASDGNARPFIIIASSVHGVSVI
jgi:hypothetical protein